MAFGMVNSECNLHSEMYPFLVFEMINSEGKNNILKRVHEAGAGSNSYAQIELSKLWLGSVG